MIIGFIGIKANEPERFCRINEHGVANVHDVIGAFRRHTNVALGKPLEALEIRPLSTRGVNSPGQLLLINLRN